MIEHEKKILLTEREYTFILNNVYDFHEKHIHTNHYYDTDSFEYNDIGITCRIREENGVYIATVKQHGVSDTSNEKPVYVKNKMDDSPFDGMNVKYFGSLKTERREATPLKGVTVVLDRNEYLNKIDYELEIEYKAGYEEVAASLLEAVADALFYSGLTEYRTDIIMRANTAPNKSQRFFRRFSELKFDRTSVSCKEQSQDFGDLAHGCINVQNGTFRLVFEGISFDSTAPMLSVKFIYNSDLEEDASKCKKDHLRGLSDFYKMKFSCGWRLDLMQRVTAEKVSYNGVEYDGYVITDENGEKSYFIPIPDTDLGSESCEEYIDVDGETRTYDAIARKLYSAETTYWFDRSGRLCKISDNYKNYIDITYIGNRIVGLSDNNGNVIFLDYNLYGQIKAIRTSDDRKIVYSYDSSGRLNSIIYPEGNRISLKYNDNNISCIELFDENKNEIYKVEYFHKENKVIKSEEFFLDKNGEYRSSVVSNYVYSENSESTIVYTTEISYRAPKERASTVSKSIYKFDKCGKVISCCVYPFKSGEYEECVT